MTRCALLLPVVALAHFTLLADDSPNLEVIHRIKAEAFENSHVMDHLFFLTDVNGPRLTGSPGFATAAKWAVGELEKMGATNPHQEKWGTFGAGGLRTKGGLLRARAEGLDPEGFKRWEAGVVFDDGDIPPPVPPGRGAAKFKRGKHGEILATKENAEIGIVGLGAACSYDEFHHKVYLRPGEKLTDHAVLLLRHELNTVYGKDFGTVNIGDAVVTLALLNGFNPVVDMLRGAEALWDGVRRLDRLGPDYFHTEDTALARACFRKTMIAAVRRARRPGVKFDQILVMESPEGWDKSSAWAVLAGEGNFSDADILSKDARAVQEELADVWIHEIADLSGLSRADVEHVKAFASRTNDRARGAYERYLKDQPRQSIEVGTTNSDSYLLSQTGNRRFWPFKIRCPRTPRWSSCLRRLLGIWLIIFIPGF